MVRSMAMSRVRRSSDCVIKRSARAIAARTVRSASWRARRAAARAPFVAPACPRFLLSSSSRVAVSTNSQPSRPRTLASCSAALIDPLAFAAATAVSYHRIPASTSPASTNASPNSSATSPLAPHRDPNSRSNCVRLRSCSATSAPWYFVRTTMPFSASFNPGAEPIPVKSSTRGAVAWLGSDTLPRNTQSGSP
jgi:hypothetical protein